MNKKTSLLLGYARRMEQVARLATEMSDIRATYVREFGEWDEDEMSRAMTGDRLAKLHAELRADAPAQPDPLQDDVRTGMGNTAQPGTPPAPGSALGLAPAPQPLVDMASTEPVKWGTAPQYRAVADDMNDRLPPDSPLRLEALRERGHNV